MLFCIALLVSLGYVGFQYLQGTLPSFTNSSTPVVSLQDLETTAQPSSNQTEATPNTINEQTVVPYRIERFAQNLNVPWSMVFTSPERLLVTERPGRIRVVENGQLQPSSLRTFPEVISQAEEGLMGITLDPHYQENRFIYLCMAYRDGQRQYNKVVRLTDEGSSLANDTILLDKIPSAEFHAGCRLRFGPDGKLYITTGDARSPSQAQDRASLGGKILRLNADGSIPADNPFAGSPVFSYGHRNPQGLDWHPVTGTLIATEHGPSGNDGPGGGDEINLIKAGQNYGWPVVSHERSRAGMVDPLLVFTPAVAPASSMFYRGSVFPQFTNHYFVGLLRGTGILHITLDASGEKIAAYEKLPDITVGRVRDIVEGPDGYLYFTTSNTDGRGQPQAGDDTIYRIVPR